MSPQLSYDINTVIGYPGLVFDLGPHDIDSRSAEGVDGIKFGIALSRGTNKDKQVLPGNNSDFFGISIRSLDREGAVNTGVIKYLEFETVGVLRSGAIRIICPTGCVPGDDVFYNVDDGVLDSVELGGPENIQLRGAIWDSIASAGELGIILLETTEAVSTL